MFVGGTFVSPALTLREPRKYPDRSDQKSIGKKVHDNYRD
jgi:hypothetical protein